jgi:hypothetical protein
MYGKDFFYIDYSRAINRYPANNEQREDLDLPVLTLRKLQFIHNLA